MDHQDGLGLTPGHRATGRVSQGGPTVVWLTPSAPFGSIGVGGSRHLDQIIQFQVTEWFTVSCEWVSISWHLCPPFHYPDMQLTEEESLRSCLMMSFWE